MKGLEGKRLIVPFGMTLMIEDENTDSFIVLKMDSVRYCIRYHIGSLFLVVEMGRYSHLFMETTGDHRHFDVRIGFEKHATL
jgi:hypothetical protein